MSNLIPFNNDGLELVIDTTTGESFASISAVARMTDKDKSSISRYVNGGMRSVAQMTLKTAEIQTPIGMRSVALLSEAQIAQVINHYKPSLLKRADELAVRVFLHGLAGYKFTSDAVNPISRKQAAQNLLGDLAIDKSFNDTLGKNAMIGTLEDQVALDAKKESTEIAGLLMAAIRLTLQDDHSMHENHCRRTMTKQLRQTQMRLEGYDSVPDHLCTKKELKDKRNALANNPSSKQHLLPDVSKLAEEVSTPKKLKQQSKPPELPEGFVIDLPLDDIY
jgi:hypothetical protein